MVGLRNAAEIVVRHQCAGYGDVPCRRRSRLRRDGGLDRHVGGKGGCGSESSGDNERKSNFHRAPRWAAALPEAAL
jgi:hypothetical protein